MEQSAPSLKATSQPHLAAPPISMSLRSSQESAKACLSSLERIFDTHPGVKASLEAVRLHDAHGVEFVVSVQPPKNAKWDEPAASPGLLATFSFVETITAEMFGYLPQFTQRPSVEDRQDALAFCDSHLPEVFSHKIA